MKSAVVVRIEKRGNVGTPFCSMLGNGSKCSGVDRLDVGPLSLRVRPTQAVPRASECRRREAFRERPLPGWLRFLWHARYFAGSFADFAIGNYMTEAVYPMIVHQDPRYFRRGAGGVWPRRGSAVGQIFSRRSDSGRMSFNFPETLFLGAGLYAPIESEHWALRRRSGIDCECDLF
jgi:hypothetical protein